MNPNSVFLSLTGRERDVLTLVVDGLSYTQIAAELFVTRSTVAFHLGNIYAKTGVTSRHQLIAVIRQDPTALRASTRVPQLMGT